MSEIKNAAEAATNILLAWAKKEESKGYTRNLEQAAKIYKTIGDEEGKKRVYNLLIRMYEICYDDPYVYRRLGGYYKEIGNRKKSKQYFQTAAEIFIKQKKWWEAYECLQQAGKKEEAQKLATEAAEEMEKEGRYHEAASLYEESGNIKKALEMHLQVINKYNRNNIIPAHFQDITKMAEVDKLLLTVLLEFMERNAEKLNKNNLKVTL